MMRGRRAAGRCREGVEDHVGTVNYRSDSVMFLDEFITESV